MKLLKSLLKTNGLIYLSVPLGKTNQLIWNHHRIYGKSRFQKSNKKLIEGFILIDVFGKFSNNINKYFFGNNNWQNQPIVILKLNTI